MTTPRIGIRSHWLLRLWFRTFISRFDDILIFLSSRYTAFIFPSARRFRHIIPICHTGLGVHDIDCFFRTILSLGDGTKAGKAYDSFTTRGIPPGTQNGTLLDEERAPRATAISRPTYAFSRIDPHQSQALEVEQQTCAGQKVPTSFVPIFPFVSGTDRPPFPCNYPSSRLSFRPRPYRPTDLRSGHSSSDGDRPLGITHGVRAQQKKVGAALRLTRLFVLGTGLGSYFWFSRLR